MNIDDLIATNQALRSELDRERAARLAERSMRSDVIADAVALAIGWFFDGVRNLERRADYLIDDGGEWIAGSVHFEAMQRRGARIAELEEANRMLDAKCTELRTELAKQDDADPRWIARVKVLENRIAQMIAIGEGRS